MKRKMVRIVRRKMQASFTVEAAFIFPILVLIIALVIHIAIEQCQMIQNNAENISQVTEYDPVPIFKSGHWLKEVWDVFEKEGLS